MLSLGGTVCLLNNQPIRRPSLRCMVGGTISKPLAVDSFSSRLGERGGTSLALGPGLKEGLHTSRGPGPQSRF